MCGRFALYTGSKAVAEYFSASIMYDYEISYNITPTRNIPALIAIDHERLILPFRWGLIPPWHKAGGKIGLHNNARAETVDIKPTFRESFRQHRCLIIADGFYEWDSKVDPKQPYYIPMKNHQPFGIAGIWSRWVSGGKSVESCCIITLASNAVIAPIHERMPAVIKTENIDAWLDQSVRDVAQIRKILADQSAAEQFLPHCVSSKVNKASFDDESCMYPLDNSG